MNAVFSMPCEPAGEEADAGDIVPRLSGGDGALEVLCQPSASAEPGEGAFHDPSARQNLEALGAVGALDDFERELADLFSALPSASARHGRIVKETRAASEPEALIKALRKVGLPLERIGLEACSLTAWLHDGLRAEGLSAICIETRAANAAMKTMPHKTDRDDARALAQIMRTGWYRQVHVKSRQCRLWRSLLVARRTVLNEMRSIENVVRAILREAGIKLGTPSRTVFAGRVHELAGADAEVMAMVEPLLAILSVRLKEFARLTKQVLDIVRKEEVCRRLMSAPGVGPITALTFRATIDRPEWFGSSQAVGAHLGLPPARYQSGETNIQGKGQPLRRRTRPHHPL
jgi:transposase